MNNCKEDHSSINTIMEELPLEQGGIGRHKCAACAYNRGLSDGYKQTMLIDFNSILSNLPTSQAGSQRHKSAHLGYIRGYLDGLTKRYQEINAFENQKETSIDYTNEQEKENDVLQFNMGVDYNLSSMEDDEGNEGNNEIIVDSQTILTIKVSDLMNHKYYLFNDFDNRNFRNRTYNTLYAQGIITLKDVLDYHGNILDLPGAGRKVLFEFNYLRDYIENLLRNIKVSEQPNVIHDSNLAAQTLLYSLSKEERIIAEHDYKKMVKEISNRKLLLFISKYSFEEFATSFCYKSDKDIQKTKGLGHTTSYDLFKFRDSFTKYLENLSKQKFNPYELNWELIERELPESVLTCYKNSINQELKDFYFKNGHLPLFKLLEIVFSNLSRKSTYGSSFVQKYFQNSQDFSLIDDDTTYERKRQKAIKIYNILKNRDSKISISDYVLYESVNAYCFLLSADIGYDYIKEAFINKDIVIVDDIKNFLLDENCFLLKSSEALSFISLALSDIFSSIGGLFNEGDSFDEIFLIKKELSEVYDFSSAVSFFRERRDSQHTMTEEYNIPLFVKDKFEYWLRGTTQYEYVERITTVLSVLIRNELELEDDLMMDVLTLKPNAEVLPRDVVYETLKMLGKPATPEDILVNLVQQHRAISTIDDVRYYLRTDNRIVYTKFEGKYDLVSNNPAIGSYRNFIRDILDKSDIPLSPADIYNLLPDSRKVGLDKIKSNLAVFQDARRYIGGLYGLLGKTYENKYVLDIQNFTPSDKLAKITNFFNDNNRLPKESDGPEWKQLRNWWESLPYRSESLSCEEQKIYMNLKAKIADSGQGGTSDLNFSIAAQNIKDFIINNRRMPTKNSSNNDEISLAHWFSKQEKRMLQESLTPHQRSIFIDLLKTKSKHVK